MTGWSFAVRTCNVPENGCEISSGLSVNDDCCLDSESNCCRPSIPLKEGVTIANPDECCEISAGYFNVPLFRTDVSAVTTPDILPVENILFDFNSPLAGEEIIFDFDGPPVISTGSIISLNCTLLI